MRTLEQIKNDYAVSKGFDDFNNLVNWCYNGINNRLLIRYIDEIMKIYAMECLKVASEGLIWKEDKELLEDIINKNNIIK